ncbi:hypothetical protein LCGC14_2465680 [marine sediment metagenome]|uniref:Uncharacterized protein n=1 Tax=marine sediment metagenome TaxID=412755 RepID=A0A0F9DP20_9ZZZZ
MNALSLLQLVISLLEAMARNTETKKDDLVIAGIQRAISELQSVRGTIVTKSQLEGLRTKDLW